MAVNNHAFKVLRGTFCKFEFWPSKVYFKNE